MGCGGGGSPEVKETPEQKEAAKVAAERYKAAEEIYKPVEDWFMKQADAIDEGDREYIGGMASADRSQAFAEVNKQAVEGERMAGTAPGSGRFAVGTLGDVSTKEAASKTAGAADVEAAHESRKIGAKEGVVSVGLGKAADATLGFGDIAARSGREAIADAETEAYNRSAKRYTLGQVAGTGAYLWNNRTQPNYDAQPPDDGLR